MKICNHCGVPKDPKEFHLDLAKKDGHSGSCKSCANERVKAWSKSNPGKAAKNRMRYRASHLPIVRAKDCKRAKDARIRLRLAVMEAYAGKTPMCACCGEGHLEFLEIDHVNGDGASHRRQIGYKNSATILLWLRDNDYPEGFQILCRNCNYAKHVYGECPHQKERNALCQPTCS